MAGWQVLDLLNFEGRVSTERGAFKIGESRVPLASLSTALVGPKCSLGAGVPHHAAMHDVTVIFCDWKGEPLSALYPWSDNTRVGARQRAQAQISEPRRKNAWMRIIKSKISSQARTLDLDGHPAEARELASLARQVRSGDPSNLEAQAARIYWQRLYRHLDFTRVPGADDALNAAHNYGYTILRGRVISATVSSGLVPSLGVFHRGRSNPFALADDLIEPFRAIVDRTILSQDIENIDLNQGLKKTLIHAIRPLEPKESGQLRVDSEIERFTAAYARYVEGDTTTLKVPLI